MKILVNESTTDRILCKGKTSLKFVNLFVCLHYISQKLFFYTCDYICQITDIGRPFEKFELFVYF